MSFVIRQVHRRGRTALAQDATALALVQGAIESDVVLGMYLHSSDPDGNDGFGMDLWTMHVEQAKRFDTHDAAFECWRAQSTVRPLRDDGKANRPMTAFSVTIAEIVG